MLGSLIRPSNLMIIYGLVSETSIPRLFLAGLMVTVMLMITTYIVARRRGYGGGAPFFLDAVSACLLGLGRQRRRGAAFAISSQRKTPEPFPDISPHTQGNPGTFFKDAANQPTWSHH